MKKERKEKQDQRALPAFLVSLALWVFQARPVPLDLLVLLAKMASMVPRETKDREASKAQLVSTERMAKTEEPVRKDQMDLLVKRVMKVLLAIKVRKVRWALTVHLVLLAPKDLPVSLASTDIPEGAAAAGHAESLSLALTVKFRQ